MPTETKTWKAHRSKSKLPASRWTRQKLKVGYLFELECVEVKEESISKEKEAKIEKSSEVKIQEEKLVSKASKSNSDSVPREAPPVPKEDESAYWTAVFDKNTGHYYYWNRVRRVYSLWFLENKCDHLDLSRVYSLIVANVLDALPRTHLHSKVWNVPLRNQHAIRLRFIAILLMLFLGNQSFEILKSVQVMSLSSCSHTESNVPLSRRGKQRWEGTGIDPLELGGKKRNNYRG